jgi:phytoene desaturase
MSMTARDRFLPRNSMGRTPRVVVVGAGPGGLAAALLLAASGASVTILEKDDVVGGRTRTVTVPGGYRFDIGPTFFLYPRILAEIFDACGERLEDHVTLKPLDPQYHLVFEGGGEIRATPDRARLAAEIAKISPADAKNVGRFLDDNRTKLEAFRPVLEQAFCHPGAIASPAMLRALRHMRPNTSVDGDLRRYFSDPRVRLAFSFQTKYLGMSPFRCPSLFTILSFLEYEHGVFHPMGGCGAVSDAMAALARRMGVDIRLGTPVERVLYRNGRPTGVAAGGETVSADAVVVNGDFGHAVRRLVPEEQRRRWPDAKIDRARLSCSTFMLYLGIEGDVGPLEHHTIFLAGAYERNIGEIGGGVLSEEPSIYVQHAGRSDPGMAPAGHTSLYVLVPVPNLRAGIDWRTAAPRFRALVLKRLAALGLGDIESRIRYERMVTPVDWRDTFTVNEGATFNLAHDLGQMLYFRPHNRLGPGLYLVGGGTHPGSGLPVIYEGARITTRLLLQDLAAERAPARWFSRRARSTMAIEVGS